MCHLIHCRDTTTAEQLAELFLEHVFRLRGLRRSIVSDQGTQFVAKFWKALCKRLDTQARLSTPYYPQTDGQTERFNAVMEQYLPCFINYLQDDWNSCLPLSEFAANEQASESTGVSPFFGN
jgi:transposase InsO family protein